MTNGATTTLASSLQVSGINNIEFTEEGEDPITASSVSYSNTTSRMTSGNVQNAIDELFSICQWRRKPALRHHYRHESELFRR